MKINEGPLAACAVCAVLWVVLSICWDFRFDLNDDVLMKDILAGRFSGVPETRNIQMLAPASALVAGLYRLFPHADVYGIFLLALQALALFLIVERTVTFLLKAGAALWMRVLTVLSVCLPYLVLTLYHDVFVQYTITVGMLASAAAYLFLTMELPEPDAAVQNKIAQDTALPHAEAADAASGDTEDGKAQKSYMGQFLRACLPSLLLIAGGFLVRSEMMLLMLPLLFGAAVARCVFVYRGKLSKACLKAAALVVAILLLTLGVFTAVDKAAYGGTSWKRFRAFFDARTELYDYAYVPDVDEDGAFYRGIGLLPEQAKLLANYNFGLDDAIDTDVLSQTAAFALETRNAASTTGLRIRNALWNYRQFLIDPMYAPWNRIVMVLYLFLIATAVSDAVRGRAHEGRKKAVLALLRFLLLLLFLFFLRSVAWGYIAWNGRWPDRIVHSLFLEETMVLLGVLLNRGLRFSKRETGENAGRWTAGWSVDIFACQLILIVLSLFFLPGQVRSITAESGRRDPLDAQYTELLTFCAAHPDAFYFLDVYSTVDDSEKMFSDYPVAAYRGGIGTAASDSGTGAGTEAEDAPLVSPANYDLLGGWASKSPLEETKLKRFGIDNIADALISGAPVYFVCKTNGSDPDVPGFLGDWYRAVRKTEVTIEEQDRIGTDFLVYRVIPIR